MRHYRSHILPIFECLPAHMQGLIHPIKTPVARPHVSHIALVASWQDVRALMGRNRMIYVEHGAGQSYSADPRTARMPGYSASGGIRHTGVIGYISPNERVAGNWRNAPSIAVGCPKMDAFHGMTPIGPPSVCFAFHWDAVLSPESRTAFDHYEKALPEIIDSFRAQGFGVYGHAHPKWEGKLDARLNAVGINAMLPDDRTVFQTASMLFVDNSSLGPEFMSLGRPIVWLNSPRYRREMNHGGRFWEWTKGALTVDKPDELLHFDIAEHLATDPYKAAREQIVNDIYAFTDGSSGERAAAFIVQRLTAM